MRLIELSPGRTVDEYLVMHRLMRTSEARASRAIRVGAWRDAQGWIATLKGSHAQLFGRAVPAIAGQLRTRPVLYGHRLHERAGLAPEHIEAELMALFNRFVDESRLRDIADADEVALWGAQFLERFFFVHPFDDGNGRIARMFVARVAREMAGVELNWQRGNSRRYVHALEYAHIHHPREGDEGRIRSHRKRDGTPRCWFGPLAAWIRTCVEDEEAM